MMELLWTVEASKTGGGNGLSVLKTRGIIISGLFYF